MRVRPSFLRSTAARKPRTEWFCQPVAAMMAATVAPSLSRASTASCLLPRRVEPDGAPTGFATSLAFLAERAGAPELALEATAYLNVSTEGWPQLPDHQRAAAELRSYS